MTRAGIPLPIPVTDPNHDAPDGALLVLDDGWTYERHGEMWDPLFRGSVKVLTDAERAKLDAGDETWLTWANDAVEAFGTAEVWHEGARLFALDNRDFRKRVLAPKVRHIWFQFSRSDLTLCGRAVSWRRSPAGARSCKTCLDVQSRLAANPANLSGNG